MTTDQARTIAEALNAGKPSYRDPAYTLWLQAVSSFIKFVEEDNDRIDPDKLESLCTGE